MDSRAALPIRHIVSLSSFLLVTLNLLIWMPLLLLALVLRLILPAGRSGRADDLVNLAYKTAVRIDAWWLTQVLRIRFVIEDEEGLLQSLDVDDSPLLVCNHRSWFDIFLLQSIISRRGPILKFLIKSELLWVPVLGWICLALNFPTLQRVGDRRSRAADIERVRTASAQLGTTPGGLLIFPEGTRYTEAKHALQHSPYKNLLRPKTGGFSAMLCSTSPETTILDVTIRYGSDTDTCWRCMSGAVDEVRVRLKSLRSGEISDAAEWLDNCWRDKESWLARQQSD